MVVIEDKLKIKIVEHNNEVSPSGGAEKEYGPCLGSTDPH